MSVKSGFARARFPRPKVAWPLLGAAALIVGASWVVIIARMSDFERLLALQIAGASPADSGAFVALTGVMMTAMMLPSAIPMLEAHRGLVMLEEGPKVAFVESVSFALGYVAVWTAVTALSLPVIVARGLMPTMGGVAMYALAGILVAAGVYQFTGWKEFCLHHCRSPMDFLTAHFRKGPAGALRMGILHGLYCLGCCWLLMIVWYLAGAMSVLWMGVFAALILAEKTWSRGEIFSRALGIAAAGAGALLLGSTFGATSM